MTEFAIVFLIAIGAYLILLGVYSIVRYFKAKRALEKEVSEVKHETPKE